MNLIDAIVTELLGSPTFEYSKWWVPVEYNAYGVKSNTKLMFDSVEEAESIQVGYKFLA